MPGAPWPRMVLPPPQTNSAQIADYATKEDIAQILTKINALTTSPPMSSGAPLLSVPQGMHHGVVAQMATSTPPTAFPAVDRGRSSAGGVRVRWQPPPRRHYLGFYGHGGSVYDGDQGGGKRRGHVNVVDLCAEWDVFWTSIKTRPLSTASALPPCHRTRASVSLQAVAGQRSPPTVKWLGGLRSTVFCRNDKTTAGALPHGHWPRQ
jgi:hypothetical protein